jgi:nucleoside-diphosphate-sugar epimerase
MNDWTIGITGGAGYIGSSIAAELSQSFNIKLLDLKNPQKEMPKNVSFKQCDVREYQEVKKAVKDIDILIHSAIIQIPTINEKRELAYEVNFTGTQNICRAVVENPKTKGLILSGSWHTIGEKGLRGTINEEFGFRPDKVEERARLYALSKMAQEATVRFFDEMTPKVFGIIRMGTVLGDGMPEKTAANIFIENGLKGRPLTPFKQSMYRPMLYVDIKDISKAYQIFATKILKDQISKNGNSMNDIFNVYYPEAITIIELAEMTKEAIQEQTNNKIQPTIDVVDNNQPVAFDKKDKELIQVDTSKAEVFFGGMKLKSPKESIKEIVKIRASRL